MGAFSVNGNTGNDTLILTATDFGDGSYVFDGGGTVPITGVTSFIFDGNGGNDAFTIINPAGGLFAPSGDIVANGGGQAGDSFSDLGGSAGGGTYIAGSANGGTLEHVVSEVQQVTVSGNSGTFTLTFNGQTTGSLAFDATATQVQNALDGLSTIGGASGSVGVIENSGVYTVTFAGGLATANQPQITATGAGATVTTTTLEDGGAKNIQLTGVATVTDTVAEPNFTIDGTAGADTITVADGPLVGGQATMQVSSPTFQTLDIANKTTVIIEGNGGADTVTFDNPDPEAGLTTIFVANVNTIAGSNPSGPDVVAPILLLEAGTDIGAGRFLQTQSSKLLADAGITGAGSINIVNGATTPTALSIAGLSATNAAGGSIFLTNYGTINVVSSGEVITATGTIDMTATGATADINTGGQSVSAITSNTGSVELQAGRDINLGDSNGNGSVSAAAGIDVTVGRNLTLNANAAISNTTSGDISVVAGGDITMLTSPGNVAGAPEVVDTASSGTISLTTIGAGYTMVLDSTGTYAVASSNGEIALSADEMVINKGIDAGTARVIIDPGSAGQAISLGGGNLPGVLGLSQAELDEVTAGVLQIGSDSSGNLTVTSPITPTPNANVLTLVSNGSISEAPGASLAAINLSVDAANAVTLDNANNAIQGFAGASASSITIVDSVGLNVGTIDSDVGITSGGGGPISLTADNINLTQAVNAGAGIVTIQPLSSGQLIALGGANAAGTLGLTDSSLGQVTASVLRVDSNSGDITVSNAVTRHAGYNTLSLETGAAFLQTAALSVSKLALRSAQGITMTNAGNDAGTLAFDNLAGFVDYTDANSLTIGVVDGLNSSSNFGTTMSITAGKDMTLASKLFSVGAATLTSTTGAINDSAAGDVVTAPTLLLSAGTTIGTATTFFHTQVDDLGADTNTGGIFITNGVTTGVTLNIDGNDGVVASGSSGNIQLVNQGSIVSLTDGDTISSPGTVTIKAQGATSDFDAGGQSSKISVEAGAINIHAGRDINPGDATGFGELIAGTGSVTLSAGRNITLNANGAVASLSGGITATAGGNIIMLTSPGNLTKAPIFATGGGAITLSVGAGQSITLATTGTDAVNSAGGNITLTGDSILINAGVNAGSGNVLIQPASAGKAVSLGTATGGLHLSQARLNEVTASRLTVGDTGAGAVTIAGTVDPTAVSTMAIKSGAKVAVSAAAKLGGAALTHLNVTAGGNFIVGAGAKLTTGASGTISINFGANGLGSTADLHGATITAPAVNVTGGAGNDTFDFSVATLTAADTIVGGAGSDELVMTNAGAIAAGGVSGVETFQLADGAANSLTLTSANFTGVGGHVITVNDGNSGNMINASTLPSADAIIVHAGTGADTLKGGAGNDIFYAGGDTTMTGGAGANQFTFAHIGTNGIADFTASDELVFSNSGFALGFSGATSTPTLWTASEIAAHFSKGAGTYASASAGFDYTGGKLFYSATGSSSNQHLVATLTGSPVITAASQLFFVS